MRAIILVVAVLWASTANGNESNAVMQRCIQETNDWNAAAACHAKYRQAMHQAELAELRDFLKHNPRYRVPGQSLNRCWGKTREMPFESAGIETNGNSMRAWVNYKDTIPAGCYENAPWDNRESK